MGQGYTIDSNVIIDYVGARLPQKGNDFAENLFNNAFLISVAVQIEVLGFNDLPDKIEAIESFVDMATILLLDEAVTKRTIQLKRQNRKLKLGDAIIAATALVHNLSLLTRNTKDFTHIPGLTVVDPHTL